VLPNPPLPLHEPMKKRSLTFNDAGEEFDKGTSDIAIVFLTVLIIPTCIFSNIALFSIRTPKK
jgi:hypothetical protein